MKIHIVMHESFEAPGAIETWATSKKHTITYTRLYDRDRLPSNADEFDFLIVMGGPQSPATSVKECPYFDANKEISLIKKAIEKGKVVLGICLGAQLLGEALGAKFEHSPNKEIGVYDIWLSEAGKQDPIFSTFFERFPVGHWHGDMPGLTQDSKILAASKGCPRQIVRYGPALYGFQCHFEFTPISIEGMIANCSGELESGKSMPYVQTADELRKSNYTAMNQLLFRFLDRMQEISEKAH